jgi:dGTPase
LKALAAHYVMRRPGTVGRQSAQRTVLVELVEAIADGAPETLDRGLAPVWRLAAGDAERLRVVVDQVAQLTDSSALTWHRRLAQPR